MIFRRNKSVLPSSGSRTGGADTDPLLAAKVQKLDALEKMLVALRDSVRVYIASWKTMCKASASIAEGLATLAGDGEWMEVSPLLNLAQMYYSAHTRIDGLVRESAQSVAELTTLREMEALLSRFPPIYEKISRRRQLLAEVETAKSKVRAAEAAKDKERDAFAVVAGTEHRRQMASTLETTKAVAQSVAKEVMTDVDRLEGERSTMLVPQVSKLVGCQAYFMRRSAAVLERLASDLPFSALALARLVQPDAPDLPQRHSSALVETHKKSPSTPSDSVAERPLPAPSPDIESVGDVNYSYHAEVPAKSRAVGATVHEIDAVTHREWQRPLTPAAHVGSFDQSTAKLEVDISQRPVRPPPPTPQRKTVTLSPSRQFAPPPPLPARHEPATAAVLSEKGEQGAVADVWGMDGLDADDHDVEVIW